MQLKVKTEALVEAIGHLGLASHSAILPILSMIKLSAANGHLIMETTDLDIHITERVEANVLKPGETLVSFRLFSTFISRAQAQEVAMVLMAKTPETAEYLALYSGQDTASLESAPAQEFPPRPEVKEAKEFELLMGEIVGPLSKVAHAISRDKARYLLTGALIRSKGKADTDIAASDGRRLCRYRTSLDLEGVDAIIPEVAVEAVLKIFADPKAFNNRAKVLLGTTVFALKTATIDLRSRLIEGQFPVYDKLIPAQPLGQAFSFKRKEFVNAVQTATLFLRPKDVAIWLEGKDKELEVGCEERFSARLMGVDLQGQPALRKLVNGRYLLDSMSVLDAEEVRIEVNEQATMVIKEGPYTEILNCLAVVEKVEPPPEIKPVKRKATTPAIAQQPTPF